MGEVSFVESLFIEGSFIDRSFEIGLERLEEVFMIGFIEGFRIDGLFEWSSLSWLEV